MPLHYIADENGQKLREIEKKLYFFVEADSMAYEVAHQFDRHGRKAVKATKDNISTVREFMEQRRAIGLEQLR